MNREEVTLLGFEIVAYAGDARSKLLEALKAAEAGDFEKVLIIISLLNLNITNETPEFSFFEIIKVLLIGIGFPLETDIAVSELRISISKIF